MPLGRGPKGDPRVGGDNFTGLGMKTKHCVGLFQMGLRPLRALEASTHSPHCQLLQGTSDAAPRLGGAGAEPVFQCPQYPPGLATWLSTAYYLRPMSSAHRP